MNNTEIEVQNQAKKNNWKSFFELKMFRYAFLKQTKSISTYIYLTITIIFCTLLLWFAYSISKTLSQISFLNVKIDKATADIYNSYVLMLYTIIFTLFITFKSLQVFREEMDDGTILTFSSMSYSRLRLIFQKWLSLQLICLTFSLLVFYISPVIYMSFTNFSDISKDILKILYKDSLFPLLASVVYQILISSVAILISLFLGSRGTITTLTVFGLLSMIAFFIPGIIQIKLGEDFGNMNLQMIQFAQLKDKLDLNKYLNDPDLKKFFELENWYTDEQLADEKFDWKNISYEEPELKFDSNDIDEFEKACKDTDKDRLANLLNKKCFKLECSGKNIKFYAIKIKLKENSISDWEIDQNDSNYNLIKSLDENNNHSEKEKKIVQLSKTFYDYQKQQPGWNGKSELFSNCLYNTNWFKKELCDQLLERIPNYKDFLTRFLKGSIDKIDNNVVYVVDDLELRYKCFLNQFITNNIFNTTVYSKTTLNSLDEVLKIFENSRKRNKINNYLNIMTQMQILWLKDGEYVPGNIDGEWELKEKSKFSDGFKQTVKYLDLKPQSVKALVRQKWLYIIYISISIVLSITTVWIINKKDFI